MRRTSSSSSTERPTTRGDYISLDGSTGKIYDGDIETQDATVGGDFGRIMAWADANRKLSVRTNADTPRDTLKAIELGAEGIGLCRTEHMFFEPDRIPKIRKMILSETVEAREAALAELLPYQKGDFKAMYKALDGRPMTIRFIDPPLHEFVPKTQEEIDELCKGYGTYSRARKGSLRQPARVQPYDGTQRMPSGSYLS